MPSPFLFSLIFLFNIWKELQTHIYLYFSRGVFLGCFFSRHITSNYPQVKYVHPELELFLEAWERMRGLLKSAWPPSCRDPLEVVMKSVTLASQLYVSIHNPSPKNLTIEPPTTPMVFPACTSPGLHHLCSTTDSYSQPL